MQPFCPRTMADENAKAPGARTSSRERAGEVTDVYGQNHTAVKWADLILKRSFRSQALRFSNFVIRGVARSPTLKVKFNATALQTRAAKARGFIKKPGAGISRGGQPFQTQIAPVAPGVVAGLLTDFTISRARSSRTPALEYA
jgi:hypothetical protein